MPRIRIRTTERGLKKDLYEKACKDVLVEGKSVRGAAKAYGISNVTLLRWVRIKREDPTAPTGYQRGLHKKVFSEEQEVILKGYLIRAADIFFGVCAKEVRWLAYLLARQHDCNYPKSWDEKQEAGKDWFANFMDRSKTLAIRRPQATSLSRATSFNRTNVGKFFANLSSIVERNHFEAKDIWNMDETGVKTVQVPDRVIACRGRKQVGAMTSAERGTLVTVALAVNAQGNHIPPQFIFPRKNYHDHFVRDGPVGCIGTASGSGWMQEADFLIFLKHFVRHAKPSPTSKVLLLLDNHGSHLSLDGIEYCREKGVVLLSFPPHCSHRLQPLDRSVYGPLKRYIHTAMDHWMMSHPAKPMTIYDLPSIVATALPSATTPSNIMAGFRCSGIFPYNPDIFSDIDFLPAYVTDRPDPVMLAEPPPPVHAYPAVMLEKPTRPTPSHDPAAALNSTYSGQAVQDSAPASRGSDETPTEDFSPEALRPFPKAGPRNVDKRARRQRSTAILTDTPVKQALEEENAARKTPKARKRLIKTNCNTKGTPRPTKKACCQQDKVECLVWCENFQSSKPGEVWVQCVCCNEWAHDACTEGNSQYVCHNCDEE